MALQVSNISQKTGQNLKGMSIGSQLNELENGSFREKFFSTLRKYKSLISNKNSARVKSDDSNTNNVLSNSESILTSQLINQQSNLLNINFSNNNSVSNSYSEKSTERIKLETLLKLNNITTNYSSVNSEDSVVSNYSKNSIKDLKDRVNSIIQQKNIINKEALITSELSNKLIEILDNNNQNSNNSNTVNNTSNSSTKVTLKAGTIANNLNQILDSLESELNSDDFIKDLSEDNIKISISKTTESEIETSSQTINLVSNKKSSINDTQNIFTNIKNIRNTNNSNNETLIKNLINYKSISNNEISIVDIDSSEATSSSDTLIENTENIQNTNENLNSNKTNTDNKPVSSVIKSNILNNKIVQIASNDDKSSTISQKEVITKNVSTTNIGNDTNLDKNISSVQVNKNISIDSNLTNTNNSKVTKSTNTSQNIETQESSTSHTKLNNSSNDNQNSININSKSDSSIPTTDNNLTDDINYKVAKSTISTKNVVTQESATGQTKQSTLTIDNHNNYNVISKTDSYISTLKTSLDGASISDNILKSALANLNSKNSTETTVTEKNANIKQTLNDNIKPLNNISTGKSSSNSTSDNNNNTNSKNNNTEKTYLTLKSEQNVIKLNNASTEQISYTTSNYDNVKIAQLPNLISNIARNIPNNTLHTAKITLSPEALGIIFVEISMKNNEMNINLKAEKLDTLKEIENRIYTLKDSLLQQGIKVNNIEVEQRNYTNSEYSQGDNKSGQSQKEEQEARKEFVDTFSVLNESDEFEIDNKDI